MSFKWLVRASAIAAVCTTLPTGAAADTWSTGSAFKVASTRSSAVKWEIGYLALSAIDAGETIDCLHRAVCDEGNPIIGSHPSAKKVILTKVGLGAVHLFAFSKINAQNPKAAMRLAQISCAVQGGVALLNARLSF